MSAIETPAFSGESTRSPLTPKVTPTPAASGAATSFHFSFRARDYRLSKRADREHSPWYLEFVHKGKRVKYSCGDTDRRAATETARVKIAAEMDGHIEAARQMQRRSSTPAYSTIGEVLESFERASPTRSAHYYALALRWVLRVVCPEHDPDTLSSSLISEPTAKAYYAAMELRAARATTQQQKMSTLRTANSYFDQAKSVFAVHSMTRLADAGLVIPDPAKFLAARKKFGFKKTGQSGFEVPDDAMIHATLLAWLRLTDRNMFIAAGVELSCGLRKSEAGQTRWNWWSERMGIPVLRSTTVLNADGEAETVRVKNQSGSLEVVPLNPFWVLMNRRIDREHWRGGGEDFVLTGHYTERTDDTFRRVSDWLRALGWKTQKTNHALRDLGASLITMKFGLDYAKVWCRHERITTTEQSYSRFVDPVQMMQRRKRLKWLHFAGTADD